MRYIRSRLSYFCENFTIWRGMNFQQSLKVSFETFLVCKSYSYLNFQLRFFNYPENHAPIQVISLGCLANYNTHTLMMMSYDLTMSCKEAVYEAICWYLVIFYRLRSQLVNPNNERHGQSFCKRSNGNSDFAWTETETSRDHSKIPSEKWSLSTLKTICKRVYVTKIRCRKRGRKWSLDLTEKARFSRNSLGNRKVKFAKQIVVSASDMPACVAAARKDCN